MTKDLSYYLNLKYPYTVEEEEREGQINYLLEIPDLPGCWAEGKNLKGAKKNLEEAKKIWIEESLERKLDVPEPSKEFSGRILLRIPPALHGQLNKYARKSGLSLNQFMRNLLEAGLNFSSLIERLDRMEKSIQFIEQQVRPKRQYAAYSKLILGGRTLTGTYTDIIGTGIGSSFAKVLMTAQDEGYYGVGGLQIKPTLEEEKENI